MVPDQDRHAECRATLERAIGPRVISPFVLGEADHLVAKRLGRAASRVLVSEVARGAYRLDAFGGEDVAEALAVMEAHADLGVSLTDASIVVLARRHGVRDLLTLDERHFRVLPGPGGEPFRVLPADAQ